MTAPTPQPAITIKNLNKSFGSRKIIKELNLTLAQGENLVILGKSGTGKSVIIKCIVRLIEPDNGEISVLGKNMAGLSESELTASRRKIGFLFQSGALYDSMSVRENLEFPLRHGRKERSRDEIDTLTHAALASVDLEKSIDLMPSELSGGMRKRLGLARTLILEPEVMLYDEPTTGLDAITSFEISQLIVDVQAKRKTSSIIITHDMECARLTSNRVAVLKDGAFAAEGTFAELEASIDPWVRSFFHIGKENL